MALNDVLASQVTNALRKVTTRVATQKLLFGDIIKENRVILHSGSAPFVDPYFASGGAVGVEFNTGFESPPMVTTDDLRTVKVSPAFLGFNVVFTDLELLSIQKGGAFFDRSQELIDAKVSANVQGAFDDLINHFLVGTTRADEHPLKVFSALALQNMITLNGLYSAGVKTGNTNGLLDFAAPSSQTDVVMDQAKSVAGEHYNQYGAATNWATDGFETLRRVRQLTGIFNKDPLTMGRAANIGIADLLSYGNIIESAKSNVRTTSANESGEATEDTLFIHELGGLKMHASSMLNAGKFASALGGGSNGGVIYLLQKEHLSYINVLAPETVEGMDGSTDVESKMFHVEDPRRYNNGARYTNIAVTLAGNMIYRCLPSAGVVANTAA